MDKTQMRDQLQKENHFISNNDRILDKLDSMSEDLSDLKESCAENFGRIDERLKSLEKEKGEKPGFFSSFTTKEKMLFALIIVAGLTGMPIMELFKLLLA